MDQTGWVSLQQEGCNQLNLSSCLWRCGPTECCLQREGRRSRERDLMVFIQIISCSRRATGGRLRHEDLLKREKWRKTHTLKNMSGTRGHPIISCTCSQRPRLHSALTTVPSDQPEPGLLFKSSIMSPKCLHPSLTTSTGGYQAKDALCRLVHVLTFLNVPSDESFLKIIIIIIKK